MNNTQIPKRYAQALFELADEMNILKAIEQDIQSLLTISKEVPEFRHLIKSPVIKPVLKKQIIITLFEKVYHELTVRFLQLMIKQSREHYLPETSAEFIALCRQKDGIIEVELSSAIVLNASIIKEIETKIATYTGLKPSTIQKINPSLLGGFVVRFGDRMYDASLKNKITKITRDFQTNIYEKGF